LRQLFEAIQMLGPGRLQRRRGLGCEGSQIGEQGLRLQLHGL
jgi:hypothetical protein